MNSWIEWFASTTSSLRFFQLNTVAQNSCTLAKVSRTSIITALNLEISVYSRSWFLRFLWTHDQRFQWKIQNISHQVRLYDAHKRILLGLDHLPSSSKHQRRLLSSIGWWISVRKLRIESTWEAIFRKGLENDSNGCARILRLPISSIFLVAKLRRSYNTSYGNEQ